MNYILHSRDEVIDVIRNSALGSEWYKIVPLLTTKITFKPRPSLESEIPIGCSRCGGVPDLPPNVQIPTNNGKPLELLAQFDLRDIAKHDVERRLPSQGQLYFFCEYPPTNGYCLEDRAAFKVLYLNVPNDQLVRKMYSMRMNDRPACSWSRVDFYAQWELPSINDEIVAASGLRTLDAEEVELYYECLDPVRIHGSAHRLLGHSVIFQHPMRLSCELLSNGLSDSTEGMDQHVIQHYRDASMNWCPLATFSSESDLGWKWYDDGILTYWIRQDDLASQKFDNTWTLLQF
ncbi:MAG: DUF1963 domain-containing protein [Planctomycetes bacterium]|nr:DUF1963 domain-containing protein [Planctomycetota bacterium]